MPTSRPSHLSYLCQRILELQPHSILDVGCGFGTKGMLFREYTDIWRGNYRQWKTVIDAAEIYRPYIGKLQKLIYDNIYHGNILDIQIPKYDLIYCGDVLEHFSREDGCRVLRKLQMHANRVIITTPAIVQAQGAVYGNEYETHKSQWTAADFPGAEIKQIDNTLIIEIARPLVYYSAGMRFYGERVEKHFGFARYARENERPVFFQGLYFTDDYYTIQHHAGRKLIFWNGSDVRRLAQRPDWQSIIRQAHECEHWCHNEQLRGELAELGIEAAIRPLFFGELDAYSISYRRKARPDVYMTVNPGREAEYGLPEAIETAQEVDCQLHVYGVEGAKRRNVKFRGRVEEEVMDRETATMQATIRLNKHDGLSQTVIKAILRGQYVLRGNKDQITQAIREMPEEHSDGGRELRTILNQNRILLVQWMRQQTKKND